MINEYIADVCDLLDMDVPTISHDDSHFPTNTTMALCNPVVHTIYLRKENNPNPDYVFSIAHELRHIYQYETDEQYYLSDYKTADKCSSIEEYNLQIAEIDANAFAAIVMKDFFALVPQWQGLTRNVIAAINKQIKHLLDTEFYL